MAPPGFRLLFSSVCPGAFYRPQLRLVSLSCLICCRDLPDLCIEFVPFISDCFLSYDLRRLVYALPYTGPADVMFAEPTALSANSFAGLPADGPPPAAVRQRGSAYAAGVFCYGDTSGVLGSSKTAWYIPSSVIIEDVCMG